MTLEFLKTMSLGDYLSGKSQEGMDPYLLSTVIGELGASLSPEGTWGRSLGGAVAGLSRGLKFARAATEKSEEEKEFKDILLRLLSGGLTPKEQPGPTSVKMGPDKMTLEISTPQGIEGETKESSSGPKEKSPSLRDFLGNLLGPW